VGQNGAGGVKSSRKIKDKKLEVLEGYGVRCYEIGDCELQNKVLPRVTIHNLRFLLDGGR
jgi:hypothetical protein